VGRESKALLDADQTLIIGIGFWERSKQKSRRRHCGAVKAAVQRRAEARRKGQTPPGWDGGAKTKTHTARGAEAREGSLGKETAT
jgi:hypothetical protein